MEWKPEVESLFSRVVEQVPLLFRPMVKPRLRKEAEKQCVDRCAFWVTTDDLLSALFEITPSQFQAECVTMVRNLGHDPERYLKLKDIRGLYQKSWNDFIEAFHPSNYHITLYVTDRCNEQCKHCAVDLWKRPDLPIEDWIRIVDNVEFTLRDRGRRGVYIFFGGEPTVRRDLPQLIQHCGKIGAHHALATNGLLFKDDYARMCADNGMSHVFISLDSGNPEKASQIRGVKKAGDLARRAIETAQRHGLFVIVNFVVMKQNIDEMQEMKDLVEGWGAAPYMRCVIKTGTAAEHWGEVGLTHEEYRRFYDFKYQHAVEAVRNGNAGLLPIFDVWDWTPFMEEFKTPEERTAVEWGVGCQACRSISGVDVNGDFLPCYYPTQLKLGNVLHTPFAEIMESPLFVKIRDRHKDSGKCTTCPSGSTCGGGCGVHSECETGDFFASVPYCWSPHEHHEAGEPVALGATSRPASGLVQIGLPKPGLAPTVNA